MQVISEVETGDELIAYLAGEEKDCLIAPLGHSQPRSPILHDTKKNGPIALALHGTRGLLAVAGHDLPAADIAVARQQQPQPSVIAQRGVETALGSLLSVRADDPRGVGFRAAVQGDKLNLVIGFSHQIIHHGRQVCEARKPKCDRCNLEPLCTAKDKTWRS